jgi:hypothetical protein
MSQPYRPLRPVTETALLLYEELKWMENKCSLCVDLLWHQSHNRLTDGGKVVSPTHRPHFTPQKHNFSASGTHFC